MKLTGAMIFYLLESEYKGTVTRGEEEAGTVENIRFLDESRCEEGCLYIAGEEQAGDWEPGGKNISLVVCGVTKAAEWCRLPCPAALVPYPAGEKQVFELICGWMYRLEQQDGELKELLYGGSGLDQIFPLVKKCLGFHIRLIDKNLSVLYDSSSAGRGTGLLPPENAASLLEDAEYHEAAGRKDVFLYPGQPQAERYLCRNIDYGGQYQARIITTITVRPELPPVGMVQLFTYFTGYIRQSYREQNKDKMVRSSRDRVHELFRGILTGGQMMEGRQSETVLEAYGWGTDDNYRIICLEFFRGAAWDTVVSYVCGQLEEEWPNSCAIQLEKEILWVYNKSRECAEQGEFFGRFAVLIREYACKAGVSDEFRKIRYMEKYLRQARTALRIGKEVHPDFWYHCFEDYRLIYVRRKITEEFSADMLGSPGLNHLIEYDREHHSEYVETLRQYLLCEMNMTHAADALYIHRTTLIRRMERISGITGMDVACPKGAGILALSLFIHGML